MMASRHFSLLALLLAGCLLSAAEALTPPPAPRPMPAAPMPTPTPIPPRVEVTAIVGGDIWTVTKGVVHNGTLLIKGAKIDKIGGPDLPVPPGAKLVDAHGKVVAPGFVTTQTASGFGGQAGSKIKDSLDPFALAIPLALATGITTGYITGNTASRFGFFQGGNPASVSLETNNAVIKMTEGDLNSMLVVEPAMATYALSGTGFFGSRPAGTSARWNLREQLRQAKEYQQKLTQFEQDKKDGKKVTEPKKPDGIDDILSLIRKERTLRVTASQVADIRWALKLVDDFGIRLVITPATEAWLLPEEIARRNVLLIITARDSMLTDERKNAPSGANADAPGILRRAGVRFAVLPPEGYISTDGELGRDLLTYPLEADFAMRGGLDAQSALEALTIIPAQILGVSDRVGSLEEGKDADVLILTGDPLDYRTFVEKTFVNGKLRYDKAQSTFFSHVREQAVATAIQQEK